MAIKHSQPADRIFISALRVEHFHENVLGLGFKQPRLSWNYSAVPPRDSQVRITITRRLPGHSPVELRTYVPWEDNLLLPWQFLPLESREEVELVVQLVAPNHTALSAESEVLRFEAGLLDRSEYWARFVGPSWADSETDHRHLPLVRAEVPLADKPVRARLYLTALGVVEAEINGSRVGHDVLTPGWTVYGKRLECWTYDVTDMLNDGSNVLGFWLGDGWYRGRTGFDGGWVNFYGDRIGVFAQLEVEYADGSTQMICSNPWDGAWKSALGPIVCSDLYEGERYDARLEQDGWSKPGFDDGGWKPVAEVTYDAAKIENPETRAVRPFERHKPVSIKLIGGDPNDGSALWMVDFGQNCTQRIRLHLHGLASGESVILRHAEVLEPEGTLATKILRRGQQRDVYTSNGADAWWEPRFAMHGFRYAVIQGFRGQLTADDIDCHVYHTDMERAGWFECSNLQINRLHTNVLWSMRSNFVSIPTDCPQRDERMGWTGDINLFAPTASYLYDIQGFLASWLADVRNEQVKWGTVPFYVPYLPIRSWADPHAIAIWGDAAVSVPWALYMDSGDVGLLERSYPLVGAWTNQVAGYLSDDGVWDRKPGFPLGQLGDWLDPSAPLEDPTKAVTQKELVATAFFARSCWQSIKIARAIGRIDDEANYQTLYDKIVAGYLQRFTHLDGSMTSDTQCAYALSIAFGLLDGEPVRKIKAGNRLAQLVRESGGKVSTGFAGTPFVLPALSETGHDDEAYDLLMSTKCPSWLYQVSMGATTTWERWDSMKPDGTLNDGGMTSFNHYALGSVADWLHSTIGGLHAIEPGWKRFVVAPRPGGGIDHAATSHLTPYGKAESSWRLLEDARLELDVTVPIGTSAVVSIPGRDDEELEEGYHRLELASWVRGR